jgi:surface carbohydrate biosynthesis protein (TIGR04326 family)
VWDDPADPPPFDGTTLLWQSYLRTNAPGVVSLPALVDAHAEDLRRRFLEFIHDLGQARIDGRTLVERLEVRPGLSYWWLGLIAQKDVYAASPHIYDVIKLFAFEDFARGHEGAAVIVRSHRHGVVAVLRAWCEGEGRRFESPPGAEGSETPRSGSWRTAYLRLPPTLRALVTFAKLVALRLPMRGPDAAHATAPANDIAVLAPYTQLDEESFATRRFASRYWSKLGEWLDDSGARVNWLHLFYRHPAVPSVAVAVALAAEFNASSPNQFHQIVDGRVPWRIVRAVLRDFLRLRRTGRSMRSEAPRLFRPRGSGLDLWPVYRTEWRESIAGSKAIVSLFHLNVLEERVRTLPRQKLGLYIEENQPWEFALVRLWKNHGHGRIVGVAHTTVPFWDLRYFFDPRAFGAAPDGVPLPDLVALNGPNAVSRFAAAGYPEDRYREVEALRYLYLIGLQRDNAEDAAPAERVLRLLVLGDLLPYYTRTQLAFLEGCGNIPGTRLEILFKPHPAAADTQKRSIAGRPLRVSTRHISEELRACDAIFVGSATSAASDAYQIGVPVISVNDGDRINFSPLYRTPGVYFVSSPEELEAALSRIAADPRAPRGSFFTLDADIPRWKRLVQEALS